MADENTKAEVGGACVAGPGSGPDPYLLVARAPFSETAVDVFQETGGSPCGRGYDYDPVQQRCVASTGLKVTLPATAPGPNDAEWEPPHAGPWEPSKLVAPDMRPRYVGPAATRAPRPAAVVAPQSAPPPIQRAASNTTPHPLASHPMIQMMRPGWRPPGIR